MRERENERSAAPDFLHFFFLFLPLLPVLLIGGWKKEEGGGLSCTHTHTLLRACTLPGMVSDESIMRFREGGGKIFWIGAEEQVSIVELHC